VKYIQECGIIPEEKWIYKKKGKNVGEPVDIMGDMVDSLVVAMAGAKNGTQ